MKQETIRVLLVEDDESQALLFQVMLSSIRGIDLGIETVDRLSEGLARLEADRFDVVLLDLMLPDSRGLDTFRAVNGHAPHTPIIVLTAMNDENLALETMEQGAQDYLVKGEVDENLLKRSIQYAIRRKQAEERLRDAEEKFHSIFEHSVEGIYQSTLDGRFVTANRAWARMLGYASPEELMAAVTDIEEQIYVDPRERAERRRLFEERGWVQGFDFHTYRKDGSVIWLSENARAVRDASGKVLYYEGIVQNITDQKRAEEALRESSHFSNTVISSAGEGIIVYDRDLRYVLWNRFMEELTGMPAGQVLGQRALDLFPHLREQGVYHLLERALSGETVSSTDTPFYVPHTGKSGWVLGTYGPQLDASGDIIGVIGMVRDITGRKRAEEALRQAEEKYRRIFENAIEGIFQSTPEGRFLTANPAMARMYGYDSPEEFIAAITDIERQTFVKPGLRADFRRLLEEQNEVRGFEFQAYRKDGSTMWLSVNARAVRDEEGKLLHYEGTVEDITDWKQAEEQLKASLREKEVLLKEIHHRVKNNLQVICSLLELQSQYMDHAEADEVLQESQNRVQVMAMVHEHLYKSRDLGSIDFPGYVQELVTVLFRSYGISAEQIRLRVNVGEVSLGVDKAMPCGLILNELVSNSLKHAFPEGREGEIYVDLQSDEGRITLVIGDNGIGFPQGLDFRNTESLGLQLVATLVEQLEGTIALHDSGGTEFTITFAEG